MAKWVPPLRVYEYVADDGTVFYSFTRRGQIISPPSQLTLQSRLGVHFVNFIAQIRRIAAEIISSDEPDEG